MKAKVLVLIIFLFFTLSCVISPEAKRAKIYRSDLETMLGKGWNEVFRMIKDWDFEILDAWAAEDPSVDMIKKHNRPGVGFSGKEIQAAFALKGKYDVVLFLKKGGTSSATTGRIDGSGRSSVATADYASEEYAIIRVVFRDKELVSYKVWPNLSSGSFSRGEKKRE